MCLAGLLLLVLVPSTSVNYTQLAAFADGSSADTTVPRPENPAFREQQKAATTPVSEASNTPKLQPAKVLDTTVVEIASADKRIPNIHGPPLIGDKLFQLRVQNFILFCIAPFILVAYSVLGARLWGTSNGALFAASEHASNEKLFISSPFSLNTRSLLSPTSATLSAEILPHSHPHSAFITPPFANARGVFARALIGLSVLILAVVSTASYFLVKNSTFCLANGKEGLLTH